VTDLAVYREVSVSSVLTGDDRVTLTQPGENRPLELSRCIYFDCHDWLKDQPLASLVDLLHRPLRSELKRILTRVDRVIRAVLEHKPETGDLVPGQCSLMKCWHIKFTSKHMIFWNAWTVFFIHLKKMKLWNRENEIMKWKKWNGFKLETRSYLDRFVQEDF